MPAAGSGLTEQEYDSIVKAIEQRRIAIGMTQLDAIRRVHEILGRPRDAAYQNTWSRIVNGISLTSFERIRAMATAVGLEVAVTIRKAKS